MNETERRELAARVRCEVTFDVPLARLSTYRIGGPATAVVAPESADDVSAALQFARETERPCIAVGLGSNVLFDDVGFDGVVLRIGKGLADVRQEGPEKTLWRVGAGLPTPLLAKRSATAGMAGLHRLVGVPGTVGGGVYMNAGAHGQEFRDVVETVSLVTLGGDVRLIAGSEVPWAYRQSGLEGVVVSTGIRLQPEDPAVLKREFTQYLKLRRAKTPFDRPCCGSVFRNPNADQARRVEGVASPITAGRLVEAAGLKGFRIGGAEVSPMHANYIVNVGEASSADVKRVIEEVQTRVLERFGVSLRREVEFIDTGSHGN